MILDAEPDDEDYIATVICPYLEISSNYTITEITVKLRNQLQNIETLWSGVEALDYGSYCKNQITTLQYDQAAKQSELEAINRQLEDNPASIELAMSKRKAEGVKAAIEGKIEIQTYRYENGIEFQSWVDRTLDIMLDKYDAYISKLNGFVTEEYFHKNGDYYEWAYADYGEYATLLNAELQDQLDAVAIGWYSINNGVEELFGRRFDTIQYARIFGYVHLFRLFAIVIAGVSVSSEHVTRTIYLLLIRPAKRYKILLSKYLSCILTTMVLIILSFGAYLLASILICGAGDLGLPYLFVSEGAVVEFDFLHWMLFRVLYCSASILFLLTLTFTGLDGVPQYGVCRLVGTVHVLLIDPAVVIFPQQHTVRLFAFPLFQHFLLRVQRSGHARARDDFTCDRRDRRISDFCMHLVGRTDGSVPADCFCNIYKKGCDEYLNEGNGLRQRTKHAV